MRGKGVCQVAYCLGRASARCSGGFRYCRAHRRPHGDPVHDFRRYGEVVD